MKQMIRYISVFVLLVCSTMAFAASKVEIAGTTDGTITSSLSGQTCTLTVTPASGYYIRKSDIMVQKTVVFSSRTRGDIPVADNLTLTGDDPAALSAGRTYTFVIPEGYDAYVTATFTACTEVTLTASIKGWTYGQTASSPSVTGNTGNATVAYTYATKGSTSFSDAVPTTAGDYTLKVSVPAIGIYTAAEATADFTIAPKTVSVSGIKAKDKEYDGTDEAEVDCSEAVFDGLVVGDDLSISGVTGMFANTIVDDDNHVFLDYENAVLGGADAGNYELDPGLCQREAEAMVLPLDLAALVTVEDYVGIFDGELHDIYIQAPDDAFISVGESEGEYNYGYANGIGLGFVDAGEYTVYYKVWKQNYITVTGSAKVKITPKTVSNPTITLGETSYVYDGEEQKPTVTVMDGDTEIPEAEYSVGYKDNVNVGTATVIISDVEGGNYTVNGSTTFAISSADGSLTPPAGISGLVYSGKAQALITAGSSATGTIEYSLDGTTYGTDIPTGTDAKEYTIYYKVEGDANHSSTDASSFKVTIAPKAVTVTADNQTKVEGETDPALTAKVEGLIGEDRVVYTLNRAEGETAGVYAITATGEAAQGNYSVTFTGAKLTITAKENPDPDPDPDPEPGPEPGPEPTLTGDLNDDGVVNVTDVVALTKAIRSGSTDKKYDINGDGEVNDKDVTALVALIMTP